MIKFNEALKELHEGFDLDASNRLPRWYFQDVGGAIYKSACAAHLFDALNKRFGNFIDPKRSIARSRNYVVTFLEEGEKIKEDVKEVKIVEDKVEIVPEVPVSLIDLDSPNTIPEVDWDWINVLKGTREDKKTLDKYAEDKFGIKLNRAKKIDGMRKDFKEALESL